MAEEVTFDIDKAKLWGMACGTNEMYQLIRTTSDKVASNANSLGAGFKTEKARGVGGKSPKYVANTQRPRGIVPVGMVYTGNYAAMKDNRLHNTLMKAL